MLQALVEGRRNGSMQLMVSFEMHVDIQCELVCVCVWTVNDFWEKSQQRDKVLSHTTGWQTRCRERSTVYHIWGNLPNVLYCSNKDGIVTYISHTHTHTHTQPHTLQSCFSNTLKNRHTIQAHKVATAIPDQLHRHDLGNPNLLLKVVSVWPNQYS